MSPTSSPDDVTAQNQRGVSGNVGDVAAGQQDRVRAALLVAERLDLGGAPAARAADRLVTGITVAPFFAPSAERCGGAVDQRDLRRVGAGDEGGKDARPEPALSPAVPAIEDRRVRPSLRRQDAPSAAFGEAVHDAADHPPVVHAPRSRVYHRQTRLDAAHYTSLSQYNRDTLRPPPFGGVNYRAAPM